MRHLDGGARLASRRPRRLQGRHQKTGLGIGEESDDVALLGVGGKDAAGAGVGLTFARRDEPQEEAPRRVLLPLKGPLSRAQRDHVPHRGAALPAQRRQEAGEDERRLAAARRADDGDKRMRLDAGDKLADGVVAAAEERRILFAEGLETPVRADRRLDFRGRGRLAAERGAEGFEAVGLLADRFSPC